MNKSQSERPRACTPTHSLKAHNQANVDRVTTLCEDHKKPTGNVRGIRTFSVDCSLSHSFIPSF